MAQSLTPVKVLLDWAWLPYHTTFLVAQEKGYYKEAGLDVQLEQGRGSATTALMLSQGGFDIAHLNVTNAAQMISKGGAIKVVGIYQHKTGAAFIGIKGKVKLDGPQSLKGIKIGSTPGGSDGLSLKVFTAANKMKLTDLNVVALDANAKTRGAVRRHDRCGERRQPGLQCLCTRHQPAAGDDAAQRLRRAADRLRLRRQQRLSGEEPARWYGNSSPRPGRASSRPRATTRPPAS